MVSHTRMKTLLKALLAIIVLAMIGWYAYQQWWINNPGSAISSITSIFKSSPKTIEILPWGQAPAIADENTWESCLIPQSWSSCKTPWSSAVIHWQAVVSYQVNSEWVCQTRVSVCNDWEYLADQEPYGLETCPSAAWTWNAIWCTLWDVVILEGQSVTLYSQASRDGDDRSCTSWERTCTDGTLWWETALTAFNCYSPASDFCNLQEVEAVVQQEPVEQKIIAQPAVNTPTTQPVRNREPNCVAPFGWWTRSPWQQWVAYANSVVWYGQTCQQQSIVCAYGSIRYGTKASPWAIVSGTLSTSCKVSDPVWCSSSCGDVSHDASITTYSKSIIPHGNWQTCEDIKIVSTCTNGTLFPVDGWSCTCQIAPPAWCIAPNGQQVGHESSLTLYQYPQVIAVPGDWSDTCVRQWRQCINWGFYDRNGNRADFTYQYAQCEIVEPDPGSRWWPGGEWVPTV